MHIPYTQAALSTLAISSLADAAQRRRCAFGDDCWPDKDTWEAFNSSISGHLIRSFPSAAVCHEDQYDAELCDAAEKGWESSFWRTNQTGAYSATLWELGEDECFINSTISDPCDQGLVPHYSVDVQEVEDIQAAVKFASEKDLYLVVKNTGHSHLGRSSGKGSFAIWTHNMKGREWHKTFVPEGAPEGTPGIPAVTLQAGEQLLDIYEAAAEEGVIFTGGAAQTVGAAGGYMTGGGHSPFAHFYGLAVDNLLEVSLVDADGEHITVNAYCDPEYFWAVRGGGGSAWGVITSATFKTHPNPTHIQVGLVQLNATDNSTLRTLLEKGLQTLPSVTEAGYTGYGDLSTGFSGIFIQPNGTNETFASAFAPFYEVKELPGINGQIGSFEFPSWIEYCHAFLQDPNIATNIIDASRLLTTDVLLNRSDELADLILDSPENGAGFNFIGKVNPTERDNTSVHPVWKDSHGVFSLSADWPDEAPEEVKKERKNHVVELSNRLRGIVGEDGGTYINEANPYEPDWENVFWGENYERLLAIKKRIDPTNLFVCNRCVGTDIEYEP